jgi:hypothetical protein
MPFAHVAEHSIIQLSSPSVTTRINEALVHDFVLDINFAAPTPSQWLPRRELLSLARLFHNRVGNVYFTTQGVNVKVEGSTYETNHADTRLRAGDSPA